MTTLTFEVQPSGLIWVFYGGSVRTRMTSWGLAWIAFDECPSDRVRVKTSRRERKHWSDEK